LFERLDTDSKGCIEVSRLIWIYQNLSPEFSSGLQRLLKAQGKSESDKLRFHEFCLLIGDEVPPAEEKPAEAAPAEPPAEEKPAEEAPAEAAPAEAAPALAPAEPPAEEKPAEAAPAEAAPAEPPAEEKPAEAAPAEAAPAEAPAEAAPAEPPAEAKPEEAAPAEAAPPEDASAAKVAPEADVAECAAPPRKATYGATRGKRKDKALKARRVANKPKIDWSAADPSKWTFPEVQFAGSYSYHQKPTINKIEGEILKAKEDLKSHPESTDGMFYQSNMTEWPEDQQKYEYVKRTGSGFEVKPEADGHFTWVEAKYDTLPADVTVDPDAYTDHMTHKGEKLGPPRMPGRAQGCADIPGIKVVDVAHPRDVAQGGVGDCWLLCSMSAVAEFHGVIHTLFKKTPDLAKRPLDTFNKYTITLYDLNEPEWKPVDMEIDERLCSNPTNSALLGAHPSVHGELWVCYLEKAIAAHCGGWDEIDGGTCTHAWRLMLGCRHVYTFKKKGAEFECLGTYNPNDDKWEQLDNSPHKGFRGLWPMVWPEVGGGGALGTMLNEDEFFDRLCAWEDANFIMACGSEAGSDKTDVEGIVQGHAYTLLEAVQNPGGADVDLIRVRNPWGQGEFTAGKWTDEGSGWKEYPEVYEALKPKDVDDGCFWMEKDEFFHFFPTVYLCALDMTTLQS